MLVFNKDNILIILKELAKRMRKTFRDVDIDILCSWWCFINTVM